jgi:hypothetical protein
MSNLPKLRSLLAALILTSSLASPALSQGFFGNEDEQLTQLLESAPQFYPDGIRERQNPPGECWVWHHGWPLSFSFEAAPWWMLRQDFEATFIPELEDCGAEISLQTTQIVARGLQIDPSTDDNPENTFDLIFDFEPVVGRPRPSHENVSESQVCGRNSVRRGRGLCRIFTDYRVRGLSRIEIQGAVVGQWEETLRQEVGAPIQQQETRRDVVGAPGFFGGPIVMDRGSYTVNVGRPYHLLGDTRVRSGPAFVAIDGSFYDGPGTSAQVPTLEITRVDTIPDRR